MAMPRTRGNDAHSRDCRELSPILMQDRPCGFQVSALCLHSNDLRRAFDSLPRCAKHLFDCMTQDMALFFANLGSMLQRHIEFSIASSSSPPSVSRVSSAQSAVGAMEASRRTVPAMVAAGSSRVSQNIATSWRVANFVICDDEVIQDVPLTKAVHVR